VNDADWMKKFRRGQKGGCTMVLLAAGLGALGLGAGLRWVTLAAI
jgi:hypothetical protein